MAVLTGLFQRGSTYYLRVVLPKNHPLKPQYKNGEYVTSLGRCSRREATTKGAIKRAEVLTGYSIQAVSIQPEAPAEAIVAPRGPVLQDVFDRWKASKPRSSDSLNTCLRSVTLYEEFTGNPPINQLTREQGDGFRTWLQHPDRKTSSKTARDRLTWVKSVLKYAARDLGLIDRNPWEGLDIAYKTTNKRRPWTDSELKTFFTQPLHTAYQLPTDKKAGADAAYWIPLLGLYTGARVGELAQLRVVDVDISAGQSIHDPTCGSGSLLLKAHDVAKHGTGLDLALYGQALTGRIKQLAERYAKHMPKLTEEVDALSARVDKHLKKMGFLWK